MRPTQNSLTDNARAPSRFTTNRQLAAANDLRSGIKHRLLNLTGGRVTAGPFAGVNGDTERQLWQIERFLASLVFPSIVQAEPALCPVKARV